jgi:hypothetical protein
MAITERDEGPADEAAVPAGEALGASGDAPAVPPGDFLADTRLVADPDPDRSGWYLGAIPEAWKVIYAFGGVSMAVALRGIEEEIARPDLDLLTANAVFTTPVRCGPLEVEARVLRSGRTAAQGMSFLRNAGDDGPAVCATATWGVREADAPIAYVDLAFPEGAGRPDDHEPPPPPPEDAPFPHINFHDQTDFRPAIGNRWWDPPEMWVDGPARFGSWTRLLNAPVLPDGRLDPLSLCVPADQLGPAIGQMLGPEREDAPNFFTLTLELGIHVLAPTSGPWLLQHTRAPEAGAGYALSIVELWDEREQLVAIAHQRARLRVFAPGESFFS